jgi:hypothetical protein
MQMGPQTVGNVHIFLYKILMIHETQSPTETLFNSEKDHDLDLLCRINVQI